MKSIPDNDWKRGVGGLVMICVIVATLFIGSTGGA